MKNVADAKERRDRVIGYSLGLDFLELVKTSKSCTGKTKQQAFKIIQNISNELQSNYGLDAHDPDSWRRLNLGLVDRYTTKIRSLYEVVSSELGRDFIYEITA